MTVKQAKVVISGALEDLQAQGVFVRGIAVTWATEVVPEDKPELEAKVRCKIALEAEL